jgi:hypothetical protein
MVLGLVGDRRASANADPGLEAYAVHVPSLHALLADPGHFQLFSQLLEYNSLWDICTHDKGSSVVHVFSFAGKEPEFTRLQTLTFTVTPDLGSPAGYRIDGPDYGFSYLRADPPVASDPECLKVLRASFEDDGVLGELKRFLDLWPVDLINVEQIPESQDHRLTFRSPTEPGREPYSLVWRVRQWTHSSYEFFRDQD